MKIESLQNPKVKEWIKLKEKKQCKNCYEEIEIVANYCPNCGFEQEAEEVQQKEETEVEEDKEETENE